MSITGYISGAVGVANGLSGVASAFGLNPAGATTPIGASNVTPPDVALTLDDLPPVGTPIVFYGFEIPETLSFGGEQSLSVQKLLGGARVIDAMGADDAPLSWAGRFRGPFAIDRATYLDAKRRAGQPMSLTWSVFDYTVIIQSFIADYQRDWEVPYRISCVVIQDNRLPNTTLEDPTLDEMVNTDLQGALDNADNCPLGDLGSVIGSVQAGMSSLQSAVGFAGPLLNNIPGLNAVSSAIGVAQVATGTAVSAIDGGLSVFSTLGGQIPGAPTLTNIMSMASSTTLMSQSAFMQTTSAYLTRMSINVTGALGVPSVDAGAYASDYGVLGL